MRALELKVPPPVAGLVAAFLMWGIARAWPSFAIAFEARTALALAIAACGLALDLAAIASFLRAGTTINPMKPAAASSLVRRGVYRRTRNPMYLGLLLLLVAWAVFLGNPAGLALAAGFVLYLERFQIAPEERILEARFGADYREYASKVRRWL
jgi:protein-S-isoprenylcysteine O-methyltransferase Ste14